MTIFSVKNKLQKQTTVFFLLYLLPYFYVLLINPYCPRGDQAPQLQAAFRLANGLGYTATADDCHNWAKTTDIPNDTYDFLIAWPPGYALIIALFIKLGISLNTSAKIFQLLFMFIGNFGWILIAAKYLKQKLSYIIFIGINFLISTFLGDSNLMLWAIFPFILSELLKYGKLNKSSFSTNSSVFLKTGILVSLLILARYQSLFLFILISIWIISVDYKNIKKLATSLISFQIIPLTTFIIIRYFNIKYGGTFSTITSSLDYTLNFNYKWIYDGLNSLIFGTLFIDRIFNYILQHFSPSLKQNIVYLISFITIYLILRLFIKYYTKKQNNKVIYKLFIYSFSSIFVFLLSLSVLKYSSSSIWVPIGEPRYYRFIFPLFLINILLLIETRLSSKINKIKFINISSIVLTLAFLTVITAYSYYLNKSFNKINHEFIDVRKRINLISKYSQGAQIFVITTKSNIATWEDKYPSYRYLSNLNNIHNSTPIFLVLIIFKNEMSINSKILNKEIAYSFRNFDYINFVKRYKMHIIEYQNYILYFKLIEAL